VTPAFHRRAPALVAGLLLLACAGRVGAQGTADPLDTGSSVVAAYTFDSGAAKADPAVSVAPGRRAACDAVEAYVWSALPPAVRSRVSRLQLFVVPRGVEDASDGTVTESEDGAGWTLSLDDGEAESAVRGGSESDRELFDEVVAHEAAHVLSLSRDQRSGGPAAGRYSDEEGPFSEGSYLNLFYQRFWKGRYPDWSPDAHRDQAAEVYDRHPDSFVTEYAATDPSEDFAESFAGFVLGRRSTSQTERGAKIRFFYDFPELVEDRDFMRSAFSRVP